MKSPNTKSSNELHQEVKEELKNVQRDVDRLQGRLTPGQIIDDAIFHSHGQNLGSTWDHLKKNPVGTTFLSLGTLMLMEGEDRETMEAHARVKLNTAKTRLNELKEHARNQLPHRELEPGMSPNLADRAKEKMAETKGKITDMRNSMQSKVSEIKQTFQSKVTDVKASVSEQGDSLQQNWESGLASGKEKIRSIDPLTYMALGAGLGALTGASLPVADFEQEFVDEKLKSKINSFSEDLQNAVNECANVLKDLVIQDAKNYSFKVF